MHVENVGQMISSWMTFSTSGSVLYFAFSTRRYQEGF